ncbi:hypothetical protein RMI40_29590 [Pseudomonas protegens]|nr:hypothetical protein [Pseudomonas protegens]MDS9878995.1 hypothetical protein [Pseudomonas protegens]
MPRARSVPLVTDGSADTESLEQPWAAADLRKTDNQELKVPALRAERRQRIGYERQLETATAGCR